jgi:tetratricopeptide (TPR) repeat protein
MSEHSRIDDLRRRVQKDPASIAFAQLGEECRRAGEYDEAVEVCRAGLTIHPGYLSARVTLGRSLLELGQLDAAEAELRQVLESAPENLAAIRGLAEIYHRRGDHQQALAQYRAALLLAPNDPDLEDTVSDLCRHVDPAEPDATLQSAAVDEPPHQTPPEPVQLATDRPSSVPPVVPPPPDATGETSEPYAIEEIEVWNGDTSPAASVMSVGDTLTPPIDDRAMRTVAALEQWLHAIHVSRVDRHP